MKHPVNLFVILFLAIFTTSVIAQSPKRSALAPKILLAKTVYFDDQTAVADVGKKAMDQLKKWGRFQIVNDRKKADLVLLLSSDPYKDGYIIMSGGQTGTVGQNGNIERDSIPNYNRQAPVRYAYLTVIDATTGESLWTHSHSWGGLLTGFNSAGERLIREFAKEIKK